MNRYTDEQRLPRIGEVAINKNVEEAKIITDCLNKKRQSIYSVEDTVSD